MQARTLAAVGVIVLIVSFISAYTYISSRPQKETGMEKIGVAVTIPPQAEFVEAVGGDKVRVTVMVPPGANPHTYEPKPSQLKELAGAKMYAKVGTRIEFELEWLDEILSLNNEILVVDCSKGVDNVGDDPHIWLSPEKAAVMVENIYLGLAQIDPANKEYYAGNKEGYVEKLNELDKEISSILSEKENRKILIYHSEWAHFARDYDLEEIPVEKDGKEPSAQRIASVIDQAKTNGISRVFTSPEFYTGSARVIAQEIGGEVVLIAPLQKNYLENMYGIAKAFAEN